MISTILIIILVLLLIGGLRQWPWGGPVAPGPRPAYYGYGYGYWPGGLFGLLLVIIVVMVLTGSRF